MNEEIFDDIGIETMVKSHFGVTVDIEKVYARHIPAGRSASATLFLTDKNRMYLLVTGSAPLTLGDVRKIVLRMGLKAEAYCPPKNHPSYFNDMAVERFKNVYPGRHHITDTDLRFYQLMVPYNPALVSITEVKDGTIRQFDSMAETGWRPYAKVQYRWIVTADAPSVHE